MSTHEPEPLDRPRQSFYHRHEGLILGGTTALIALGIWQASWSAGKISPLFFTGPSAVLKRFGEE